MRTSNEVDTYFHAGPRSNRAPNRPSQWTNIMSMYLKEDCPLLGWKYRHGTESRSRFEVVRPNQNVVRCRCCPDVLTWSDNAADSLTGAWPWSLLPYHHRTVLPFSRNDFCPVDSFLIKRLEVTKGMLAVKLASRFSQARHRKTQVLSRP